MFGQHAWSKVNVPNHTTAADNYAADNIMVPHKVGLIKASTSPVSPSSLFKLLGLGKYAVLRRAR